MIYLRKIVKMNRKKTVVKLLPVVLVMLLSPLTLSAQKSDMSRAAEKYSQVLYLIDRLYLEDVDFAKLVEEALVTTMGELDPHSSYISAEDAKAMNEPLQGYAYGAGDGGRWPFREGGPAGRRQDYPGGYQFYSRNRADD